MKHRKLRYLLFVLVMIITSVSVHAGTGKYKTYSTSSKKSYYASGKKKNNHCPYSNHSYVCVEYQPSFCDLKGHRLYKCKNCNYTKKVTYKKNPNKHRRVTRTETIKASCEYDGLKYQKCKSCGKTIILKKYKKKGHKMTKYYKPKEMLKNHHGYVDGIRWCKREGCFYHEVKESSFAGTTVYKYKSDGCASYIKRNKNSV